MNHLLRRPILKVWKRVSLSKGLELSFTLLRAIGQVDEGCIISNLLENKILDEFSFKVSNKKIEFRLVVVSVAELGYMYGATLEDIYTKAREFGLVLSSAEVGVWLYRHYPAEITMEEPLVFPSNSLLNLITVSPPEGLYVLTANVKTSGETFLRGYFEEFDNVCGSECRFVFFQSNF